MIAGVDLPTFSEEVLEGTEDLKHPSSGIAEKLSENMEDAKEDVPENNSNNGISNANETNDDDHESNSNQEIVNSVVNSNVPISDIMNQENHDETNSELLLFKSKIHSYDTCYFFDLIYDFRY